jgi:hypothetical protein
MPFSTIPTLGRPPPLGDDGGDAFAQIRNLRSPDSLFLALFLRRLPSSIRDHLAAKDHKTATEMGKPCRYSLGCQECRVCQRAVSDSLAAESVRSASPRAARSPVRRVRSPDRRCDTPKGPQHRRRPTPGRQDNRSGNSNHRLCFYQDRYGMKALKCHAPCSWTENKVAAVGNLTLSAASSIFRIRFPISNFSLTQVPPSQFFLTGLLLPLQVRYCPGLMVSQFLPALQKSLDLCIPEKELAKTRSQIPFIYFKSHS